MARQPGLNNFAGTLEVLAGGPLDARSVVPALADLTAAGNFPYSYIGMETYVIAEDKKYRLIGSDPTVSENWVEVAGGGSGAEVFYVDAHWGSGDDPESDTTPAELNAAFNSGKIIILKFYNGSDPNYALLIYGESNQYRSEYLFNYINYAEKNSVEIESIKFTTRDNISWESIKYDWCDISGRFSMMPIASGEYYGSNIYQYTGTTTQNYKQGHFYKCVQEGSSPNFTYRWVEVQVQDGIEAFNVPITANTTTLKYETTVTPAQLEDAITNDRIIKAIFGNAIYTFSGVSIDGTDKYYLFNSTVKTEESEEQAENTCFSFIELKTEDGLVWSQIKLYDIYGDSLGQQIQVETMPTASIDYLNKTVQYVGETTADYVNSYFYKCVEDDTTTPVSYVWERINAQPNYFPQAPTSTGTYGLRAITDMQGFTNYQWIGLDVYDYSHIGYMKNLKCESEGDPDYDDHLLIAWKYDWKGRGFLAQTNLEDQPKSEGSQDGVTYYLVQIPKSASKVNIKPAKGTICMTFVAIVPKEYVGQGYRYLNYRYYGAGTGSYWTSATAVLDCDKCREIARTYTEEEDPNLWIWCEFMGEGFTNITNWDASVPTVTYIEGEISTVIQHNPLPVPAYKYKDKILEYVGETNANYTNGYFYKCIEDPDNVGTYIWVQHNVQPGGSGGGSLGKAITAAIEVGGIDIGDSFAIGTSYDDMWDALLNPTLYPSFTNPSASLSYAIDTYYEVGATIAAKTATASLNRGSISPAYGTSGYRSGEATNYAVATTGADTEYSDSSASSGAFSVPALTRATKGTIVLTATVSYAAGEQPKDSKGNNYDSPLAAGSKTASKTATFIQAYYYGKSATTTVSDFTGLTKSVTAKGQKQFKFTTNNEHMVIAYDSSYGNLSSILDPNGFETISGWTKSTLTVGGFSYYVYVANSATTDTNAQFTFKY